MNIELRIQYRERMFVRACTETLSSLPQQPKQFLTASSPRPTHQAHTQLHEVKRQLLREMLNETPEARLFKPLCAAANQAADLAWATPYPMLVFPGLFEDLAQTARNHLWKLDHRERNRPDADADPDMARLHPVFAPPHPILADAVV